MRARRVIIIGGTAAGPAAAAEAKRQNPKAEAFLFERGSRISTATCDIPFYVAGQIAHAKDLVRVTPEKMEKGRGVKVFTKHEVVSIDARKRNMVVKDLSAGEITTFWYDAVILATGSHARSSELGFAHNVFSLRNVTNAENLRHWIEKHQPKHAVVLGAGYVGLEMAEALIHRNIRVTVLECGEGPLGSYLEAPLRPILADKMASAGVIYRYEKAVEYVKDISNNVKVIKTSAGEQIGCDLVIEALGVAPETTLATSAGVKLGKTGAISVDDKMQTNVSNIWACGDCVEVKNVITQKSVYMPISPVAFRTGRTAGANAMRKGAGAPKLFPGTSGSSAVKLFGLEIGRVGLGLEAAKSAGFNAIDVKIKHDSRSNLLAGVKPIHVRFILDKRRGRLLGAEVVGEEGAAMRANVLVPLIRDGWSVDKIVDLDLVYNPPLSPARDPLLIAASVAIKAYKSGRR